MTRSAVDEDADLWAQHTRAVELIKAQDPKYAKILAKRDRDVARANSHIYNESRLYRWLAAAAIIPILGISGCTAYTWGYQSPGDIEQMKIEQEMYDACLAENGEWIPESKTCDP